MQKCANKIEQVVFSNDFIVKFTDAVEKLYAYDRYMDFCIVASIFGHKTLSYLPLLNYTDRAHNEIDDLLELAKDNSFQIKSLNFSYTAFEPGDMVTMRLDIHNSSSEEILKNSIKSRCRNKIRNSIKKYDYAVEYGNDAKSIDDFYEIFSATMYKHGTPVLDKKLFFYLAEEFGDDMIFFNAYDNDQVIASMCMIVDEEIAWYPWGGVDAMYNRNLAGYFIYWQALQYICDNTKVKIFDFGRSSYGGSTYDFKSQFGAYPVKIDVITSNQDDLYSKYSLASKIWTKLPKTMVDYIGPKLCKYLVDL